jgi:hypothetical protein
MKIHRLFVFLLLPLACAIFSAGCATNHPHVNTWRDSQFSPSVTNTIALTIRVNPTPADKFLTGILTDELKRAGFHLVPLAKADYLITYAVEDDWKEGSQKIVTPTLVSPLQTPEQMGVDEKIYSYTPVVFHSRGIRLYLYTNPKTRPGGLQVVWQGYIAAGQKISADRVPVLIRTLLGYLGKSKNGRVNLVQQ